MFADLASTLFDPFQTNEYCDYFFYVSVFCFLFLVGTAGLIVKNLVTGTTVETAMYFGALHLLIAYFINRLLYSMCVRSLERR